MIDSDALDSAVATYRLRVVREIATAGSITQDTADLIRIAYRRIVKAQRPEPAEPQATEAERAARQRSADHA